MESYIISHNSHTNSSNEEREQDALVTSHWNGWRNALPSAFSWSTDSLVRQAVIYEIGNKEFRIQKIEHPRKRVLPFLPGSSRSDFRTLIKSI
jgi:hypothetical protein